MKVKVLVHKTEPDTFGRLNTDERCIEETGIPEIMYLDFEIIKTLSNLNYSGLEDYEEQIWELTPKKD